MRNTVCKILVLAAMIAACDKPYEMDLPLSVDGRHITLSKDGGSTHVLVYSTGDWTAHFDHSVLWAAIDRTSGHGNSELIFSFGANYGIARRVGIVLESGSVRDTVFMLQNGPVTTPSFRFTDASVPVLRVGGDVRVSATSNLYYSADALVAKAIYTTPENVKDTVVITGNDSDPSHWILSATPAWNGLAFTVADNASGSLRNAQILMNINDPTGRTLKSVITVNQTMDGPKFTLKSISGTYEKEAATVTAETSLNNIYPYGVSITVPETCDWISALRLTSQGLQFNLSENVSGKLRSAKISIDFTDDSGANVKASFTVMQKG